MARRKSSQQPPSTPALPLPTSTVDSNAQATKAAGSSSSSDVVRVGKDEMNLVEYPFATLRPDMGADAFIQRHWEAEHPITRRSLKASWRVTGDPLLGLPTPSEERLFLVLMELSREAGFTEDIYFTRYGLIQRLGWPDNAKSYTRLTEGFRRLTAVTITSENAFWNPAAKSFHNRGFHILEAYDIVAERPGRKKKGADLPLSHFRWSREMRDSFAAGYIRSIDLGIALTLILPLSARLFRYLDKKKYDGKTFFDIEVRRLCEIHLGMTPTKHTSTLKVRLQPAHEELLNQGIVQGIQYLPMKTKSAEKVRYLFTRADVVPQKELAPAETPEALPIFEPVGIQESLELGVSSGEEAASANSPERALIVGRMTELGVSAAIAFRLVQDTPLGLLARQMDCLAERKPKDAAATFVASVRGGWAPPAVYTARLEVQEQRVKQEGAKKRKAAQKQELEQLQSERAASEKLENEALNARFEALPAQIKDQIEAEVAERMKFVATHVGADAAKAGWSATRRQVLRERDAAGLEKQDELSLQETQTQKARVLMSKDAELDLFFDGLSPQEQASIESEVSVKLTQTGLTNLTPAHKAWAGVRRTVLREKIKHGQLLNEL